MACNTTILDTNVEESRRENEDESGGDQAAAEAGQVEKIKHHFSEPWEDSDVILVVEDEKFHVHRLILSMNSPVFKAMFKSQFKEATANEIPLPEKKANEILDFLKKVYGLRYVKEQVKITSKLLKFEGLEHGSFQYCLYCKALSIGHTSVGRLAKVYQLGCQYFCLYLVSCLVSVLLSVSAFQMENVTGNESVYR
ncbi:hypothetical protein OS493_000147 [Desmophyllum pertusum]|uniref:BTB domain-containing protein n=1 Tax=Desmophyllum pertusum TaxID=174260 RepID=A0A9X0A6Q5_9CNID|nr:hypothetical protein OS493_000147 [Desmophyllum pertusum]